MKYVALTVMSSRTLLSDYIRFANICSEMFTGVNVLMSSISVTE